MSRTVVVMLSAALAIGVACLCIAHLADRGSPPHSAIPVRMAVPETAPSTSALADRRDRLDPATPPAWELFGVGARTGPARRSDYVIASRGVGTRTPPAAPVSAQSAMRRFLVVHWRDHARAPIPAIDAPTDLLAVSRVPGARITFTAADPATTWPSDALLVDRGGTPFGSVVRGPGEAAAVVRLALPFHGTLLASGYANVPVDLREDASEVSVDWRRCGSVRGALTGPFVAGETIQCEPADARRGSSVGVGVVEPDGSFIVEALPVGTAFVTYSGSQGELRGTRIEVLDGDTDVGPLRVTPLGTMGLRLARPRGAGERRAFVNLYFTRVGKGDRQTGQVSELSVDPQGCCEVRQVRGGGVAGSIWTPDGAWGEIPPSDPTGAMVGIDPIVVAMHEPGTLRVLVDAPFVLAGGWTVVAVDARYRMHATAHGLEPDGGRTRVAVRAVTANAASVLEIDRLWPVVYAVSLVSPEGLVVAEQEVEVYSGLLSAVDLRVGRDRGSIVLRSSVLRPVRCMLLAADGGVACRVTIEPGSEHAIRGLWPGHYKVLRLEPSRAGGAQLEVPERHEVELAIGDTVVVEVREPSDGR